MLHKFCVVEAQKLIILIKAFEELNSCMFLKWFNNYWVCELPSRNLKVTVFVNYKDDSQAMRLVMKLWNKFGKLLFVILYEICDARNDQYNLLVFNYVNQICKVIKIEPHVLEQQS